MARRAREDKNLQPFTGDYGLSKWVKNSRMGRKTPIKQTILKNIFMNQTIPYNK